MKEGRPAGRHYDEGRGQQSTGTLIPLEKTHSSLSPNPGPTLIPEKGQYQRAPKKRNVTFCWVNEM